MLLFITCYWLHTVLKSCNRDDKPAQSSPLGCRHSADRVANSALEQRTEILLSPWPRFQAISLITGDQSQPSSANIKSGGHLLHQPLPTRGTESIVTGWKASIVNKALATMAPCRSDRHIKYCASLEFQHSCLLKCWIHTSNTGNKKHLTALHQHLHCPKC